MTQQEIQELAGHRQVPAWVVKLVGDCLAKEREQEPVAWKCVCGANLYVDKNGVPTSKGRA